MKSKGIVFDIKKYALHDGPGIRTTIFFKGCPLDCWWCHNPESRGIYPEKIQIKRIKNNQSSVSDEIFGREYNVEEVIKIIKQDSLFYDESKGGVTFSGGEPLMQLEFLDTLLTECKKLGINTAVDTSGYANIESFKKIINKTDLFLFDLKIIDEQNHIMYTGVSNNLVFNNLEYLCSSGAKVYVRIPLIPEITDTSENLNSIIDLINKFKNIAKIDLLPFNELSAGKCKRLSYDVRLKNMETQSKERITEIEKIFKRCKFPIGLRG